MRKVSGFLSPLVATLALGAGCAVHQTEAPPLTGPSELALALRITATPDSINQDGASQAAVALQAFGPTGQPASGVTIRLDMQVGGVMQDFGTLSARTLVTGNDGRASAIFTAPPPPPANLGGSGTVVSIVATPTGNNFQSSQSQSADIRLVTPGVILPPAATPTPDFSISPKAPQIGLPALFDASISCAGAAPCTSSAGIVDFTWSFGDGTGAANGRTVSHTFASTGDFQVTLTVTNDRGVAASKTTTVTVGASAVPHAEFGFSPGNPVVGQPIQFNASASTATPGRRIVQYIWVWGDLTPNSSGVLATHTYQTAGSYSVTLTVTDDAQQSATTTGPVVVGTGNPTAVLNLFKSGGNTIQADASGSTAAGNSSIVSYRFMWGDNTPDTVGAASSASHTFASVGAHTVTLIVTDSAGRTASVQKDISTP